VDIHGNLKIKIMEKLTHWRSCDKTDFLGAADLEDILSPGKTDVILTIAKVEIKNAKVRGQIGSHRIATFKEKVKPMIINVGNGRIIKKFANNDSHLEKWKDIAISVYIDSSVLLKGEKTEGLRIRPVQPKLTKPDLKPDTPQWKAAVDFLKGAGSIPQIKAKYNLSPTNEQKIQDEITV
jgi:hypothetical protein